MKWTEVRIKTTQEASDAVTEMLTSIGAGGVAIEDPEDIRREIERPGTLDYADDEFINSLGEDVIIKAYFSEMADRKELLDLINEKIKYISEFLDTGKGLDGWQEVDDEDWSTAWKKYYKPLHLSEHLVIKPSWEQYEPVQGETVIELDPGMAFGTGTHETTRMCAQLLERCIKPGDIMLDVGCGSGILSIVGAKLGAAKVTAVDIDETAVRVARENCELNGVEKLVEAFKGELKDIPGQKADVVAANIIADVIVAISGSVPEYLKPEGFFITSGIIKERKADVVNACFTHGFCLEAEAQDGEWVAMVFKCQGSL